jgi:hypothetical protein
LWARLAFESLLLFCLRTRRIERPAYPRLPITRIATSQTPTIHPPYIGRTPLQEPEITHLVHTHACSGCSFVPAVISTARNHLRRRIGKTIMPSPETCNSTGPFSGHPPPSSRIGQWRRTSFHVQIYGMYNSPVTIRLPLLSAAADETIRLGFAPPCRQKGEE